MGSPNEKPRWYWFAGGAAALFAAAALLVSRPWERELPGEDALRVSSGTFSGSLDALLKAEGLPDAERFEVSSALAKKLDLRRLRPEDSYELAFSTAGALRSLSITKGLSFYRLSLSENGGYGVTVDSASLREASGRLSGVIKSSLWESMTAAGVPPAAILDYADIFSWSVDFLTEVRDGDRWALVWTYASDPSGKVISQHITAAAYDGAETGRKAAAAWRGGYYDGKGESLRSMFLRAPLHYRRISSYFTNRRFHPILKIFRAHQGIDYAAPSGTPVSAVADGTVVFAGWKGANGRLVILRHAAGYETTYGHLSRFAKGLRAGRRVGQGEVIAYVGSTGLSSGPHLDFRLKQGGKPLNFLKIKYRSGGSVSGKARDFVAAAIKALGD